MFLTRNKNSPILDFSLRTVLVVGASSGIGFEVANQIKHLGRNLIVAARRLSLLEENLISVISIIILGTLLTLAFTGFIMEKLLKENDQK